MAKTEPMTPAERVRASEARKVKAGWRRIPGGMLAPEVARALDRLQEGGYGESAAKCIARAILEAERKLNRGR